MSEDEKKKETPLDLRDEMRYVREDVKSFSDDIRAVVQDVRGGAFARRPIRDRLRKLVSGSK